MGFNGAHNTVGENVGAYNTTWALLCQGGCRVLFLKVYCGGINPYTLTAKLGLARISGSGPPKDDVWPDQPVRSPAQGVKTDLAIKQDLGRLE